MAHLSISALGSLQVTLDGQRLTALAYDKVWALLVYLALAPDRAHQREALAGLLWPDQSEQTARTNLRQALARLRQAIGDHTATPPFLLIDRERIQFNVASDHTFDVATFLTLLAASAVHPHRHAHSCSACAERRTQAVARYAGVFLDKFFVGDSDLFEEWVTVTREHLHRQALDTLAALAVYHEQRGAYAEALRYSARQLELDPWREEAHRHTMRILALDGQRSAALAQYERCQQVLAAELGVEPAAETVDLYERIRSDTLQRVGDADPLSLPAARPHNLPPQPTPFVGREQELATLAERLADPHCRLITLLGPGGIGKTRLALQTATEQIDAFAHGVAFVALAGLNAAEFLASAIATALDITLAGRGSPQVSLLNYLRSKEMLMVLDNFEHLLTPRPEDGNVGTLPATSLLADILRQAPGITLLVTSRERLQLHSEWVFDVAGLTSPPTPRAAGEERQERFEQYSAVALFLQQARRVQMGFVLGQADQVAVARICHLVQGMPLALELAAAWVRVLSCAEIVQELEQSLDFLSTTLRDAPARHRSLQAVFDHSWRLLSEREQQGLMACSSFRGGFTRAAAEAVTGATLPLLAALVDKSWLRWHPGLAGRYGIHELARHYGAQKLAEAQAVATARNRHLTFFMHYAEEAEHHLLNGQQATWFDRLEREHDNLRAALEWSLTGGDVAAGLRMVGALYEFWLARGHARTARAQAERFLADAQAAPRTLARAKALHTIGLLNYYQGEHRSALAWLAESMVIARELGAEGRFVLALAQLAQGFTLMALADFSAAQRLSQATLRLGDELENAWIRGSALHQVAWIAALQQDPDRARPSFVESIEYLQRAGHRFASMYPLCNLGIMLFEQADYATAQPYLAQALAISREMGDKIYAATCCVYLGGIDFEQGDAVAAHHRWDEALALLRDVGDLRELANSLDDLGRIAQRHGDHEQALAWHRESLTLHVQIGNARDIATALEALACLATRREEWLCAAQLFGAAAARFATFERPLDPPLRPVHDHLVGVTRVQLSTEAFTAAWAVGEAMPLEEAVALALAAAH